MHNNEKYNYCHLQELSQLCISGVLTKLFLVLFISFYKSRLISDVKQELVHWADTPNFHTKLSFILWCVASVWVNPTWVRVGHDLQPRHYARSLHAAAAPIILLLLRVKPNIQRQCCKFQRSGTIFAVGRRCDLTQRKVRSNNRGNGKRDEAPHPWKHGDVRKSSGMRLFSGFIVSHGCYMYVLRKYVWRNNGYF